MTTLVQPSRSINVPLAAMKLNHKSLMVFLIFSVPYDKSVDPCMSIKSFSRNDTLCATVLATENKVSSKGFILVKINLIVDYNSEVC